MAIVTLDQYNQQQGTSVNYDALNQQNQQQQGSYSGYGIYNDDEGSILDTIGKKWDTTFEAIMASNAGKEHSEFAAANLKRKADEARVAREKLGMTGQVIAGASDIIPIAAASAVNPYLGAATAGAIYTGNTAAEQAMAGQDVNWKTAGATGGATMVADLATGGLAGRFRSALPAAAPLAKRVGINVAEDATSSIAGNAFMNMALGKEWDEGIVEAGLMGAGAGGAVRGGLHGFSQARNTAVNKFGEKTVKDITQLSSDARLTPTENFSNEAFAYSNESAQMLNDAANAADPQVRAQNIEASVNMAAQGGGRAADLEAMQLAQQYNIPFLDTAFDIDVASGLSRHDGTYKLYKEMGISDKEVQKAGEAPQMAQQGRLGRTKTSRQALDKESYEADFKTKMDDAMGAIKGTFNTNVTTLRDIAYLAGRGENADPAYASRVNELAADASQLQTLMEKYTGSEKLDVSGDLKIVSKRLLNGLMETGLMNKMVGLDGKTGSYDPVKGVLTVDRLGRMAAANMPNYKHSSPNRFKNTLLGTGLESTVLDATLAVTASPMVALARRGAGIAIDESGRHLAQRRLRKLKEKTSGRLGAAERAVAAKKAQAMAEGDMALVAKAAEEQLNMGDVDTGPTPPSPFDVDAAAQAAPQAAAQSAPVPARDPRQTMAMLDAEEQAAVMEVSKTDPVGAEQLAEQLAAQKSAPVPAAEPTRRVPTPEPAPQPDPAMMSRSLAAQPSMTPEAQRAQMAAQLQEAVLAEAAARQAQPADTVPEVAPEAPVSRSPVPAREPKQPQPKEPEVAPEASESAPARADSKDLVRAPLQKDKEQFAEMSANDKSDMLNTNPERLKELRNAAEELKQTNTLLEKMSSKHKMSTEATATYLDAMGGVRGVKQAIKDENLNSTVHEYVDREIRRMELEKAKIAKEKIAEIRNAPKPKPVKVEPSPEEKARIVADKHIGVREELDSLGYDKDVIDDALKKSKATDTTSDFDPKIVKNWARTLSKQQLAKAKQDAKDADAALAAAAPKLTIADSTKELNDYIKGIDAGDVPGVREMIDNATRHLKSPLTEAKMASVKSRIDDAIKREEQALSDALSSKNRKTLDPVAQNKYMAQHARYKSYVDQIAKNKAKIDADKAAKEAELQKAQEQVAETQKAYTKLFDQAEKRMAKLEASQKDAERLNVQKDEIRDRMVAEGATKQEADEYLAEAFPYQEKSLSNAQFTRARDKAAKSIKTKKEAEVQAAKEAAEAKVKEMDDAELEAAAKQLVELDNKVKDYSDPEVQSLNQLVADELEARGQQGEAAYMRAFTMILDKAERRKKAYPGNKEYWISSDDKQKLQSLMNQKQGSSYLGNLQVQLASRFFGDEQLRRKYIRLSEDEIQSRIDSGIIDSDIVAKPKKNWKQIARKVNKK